MNELQVNNPEMGMKDFVAVLRRRIWLILPILLLCLAGAYEWTLHTPKTWRAEAQVEVLHNAAPSSDSSIAGVPAQSDESVETQIGLIEGEEMARRTLAYLKDQSYGASATAQADQDLQAAQDAVKQAPNPTAKQAAVEAEKKAEKFRADLPVYKTIPPGMTDGPNALTEADIADAVKVTNPIDSSLINITADANGRDQAIQLADAVSTAFVEWKNELAQKNSTKSKIGLSAMVKKAHTSLDNAEKAEMDFKQANHLANVDAEEQKAIEQLAGSDSTVVALNEELASRQSTVRDLDAELQASDKAVASANGVPDEAYVLSLHQQLGQLKIDRADAGTKYNYNFPGMPGMPTLASLDAEIKAKKLQYEQALKATTNHAAPSLGAHSALSQMDNDAHVQLNLTQAKLDQAKLAQQTYQQSVEGMPSLQKQYAQLHRATTLADRIYTSYNAALSATTLQQNQVTGNVVQTANGAAPLLPFKPNLKTNLFLGLALGALLSLGLVMLLEQTDQRVRTLDEVRALVSGPIIGMLPRTSRGQMKELAQGRLLPQFEEAFSLVRVNLSFVTRHSMMRDEVEHQIILVTSAVPGEGKSVAAAELARSMAEAGKTVILVDANLRRPSQNILFQTGETGGLTDVLSGQLPLDEAIATSNIENLSILNSGVSNQNPTVLLSQPRLASVMEALRYKADVVIVDAPDCTSAADTLLLTAHADCLLQVVRAGMVDMETLHNASLALHSTGKKVTVLANGLTRPQQRTFKKRFAYAALSGQSETPALPQTFEKTMVMNRSRDLVFSKSANKSLEDPEGTPEKNEAS